LGTGKATASKFSGQHLGIQGMVLGTKNLKVVGRGQKFFFGEGVRKVEECWGG